MRCDPRHGEPAGQREQKDIRFVVYRMDRVSYFNRTLCRRAFGIKPEEAVSRLQGNVERASLVNDGLDIVAGPNPLELKAAHKVSWEQKRLLTTPS